MTREVLVAAGTEPFGSRAAVEGVAGDTELGRVL